MVSNTNTLAMGGGQITQNVVSSTGQPVAGIGVLGQNVPGSGMQPRMRMPVNINITNINNIIYIIAINNYVHTSIPFLKVAQSRSALFPGYSYTATRII